MKLLLDSNVVLDYMLTREPYFVEAAKVIDLAVNDKSIECVSASAVTDLYYIAHNCRIDSFEVQDILGQLFEVIRILPVTEEDIKNALKLRWRDFEDAVQYSVALSNGVDYIVTRNQKDFESQTIPSVSPAELLAILGSKTRE